MLKKQNLELIMNNPESIYPFLNEMTEKDLIYIFSRRSYIFGKLMESGLGARMITSSVQAALIRDVKYRRTMHPDTLAECFIKHNIRLSMDTLEWMAAYSPRTLLESGHDIPRVIIYYGICYSGSDANRVVMANYARKHSVPLTEQEIKMLLTYHEQCLKTGLIDFLKQSNALEHKSIQKQIVTNRYLLNRIMADARAKEVVQNLSTDMIDLALQTDSSLVVLIYRRLQKPTPDTTMVFLKNATTKSELEFFLRELGADDWLYNGILNDLNKYTAVNFKNMSKPLMIALINSYQFIQTLQWFKTMEMILQNNSNLPQDVLTLMQSKDPTAAHLIKRYVHPESRLARAFDRVKADIYRSVNKRQK